MKRLIASLFSVISFNAGAQTCLTDAIETSPSGQFTEVTNDQMLDNNSQLIWQRCALGQTFDGSTCTGEATRYTWQEALVIAQQTAHNTQQAWRLPNVKELATITERQCVRPAINESVFPNTPSDDFWTSTPSVDDVERAWVVAFFNSSHSIKEKDRFVFVRLVRQ